jgi:hypothetical protein
VGMGPVSAFCSSWSAVSIVSAPIDDGMEPASELRLTLRRSSLDKFPSSSGSRPVSWFSFRSRSDRSASDPISTGIDPVIRRFDARFSCSSRVSIPSSGGKLPRKKEESSTRPVTVRFASSHAIPCHWHSGIVPWVRSSWLAVVPSSHGWAHSSPDVE